MPYNVELIICLTDHSWDTDFIEVSQSDDPGQEAIETWTENYNRNKLEADPEIVYVGVYHIKDLEDENFVEEDLDKEKNDRQIGLER